MNGLINHFLYTIIIIVIIIIAIIIIIIDITIASIAIVIIAIIMTEHGVWGNSQAACVTIIAVVGISW